MGWNLDWLAPATGPLPTNIHWLPLIALEIKVSATREITGFKGIGLTVMTVGAEKEKQPFPPLTLTTQLPLLTTGSGAPTAANGCPFSTHVAFCVIELLSDTCPPWQKVVGPLAPINATGGVGFTVVVIPAEVLLQLLALVT